MITKKTAIKMGPAMALADVQKPTQPPTRKTVCKRKHSWKTALYNRRCVRCGVEEEKTPSGCWEPIRTNN